MFVLGARTSVADEGFVSSSSSNGASTNPLGTVIETTASESTVGGPVAEPRSTATGAFDLSYLFVLSLGIAGLIWIRRQSQTL
jgi:hypothetical protein